MTRLKQPNMAHQTLGKTWTATGIVAGTLLLGSLGTVTAHADQTSETAESSAATTQTAPKAATESSTVTLKAGDTATEDESNQPADESSQAGASSESSTNQPATTGQEDDVAPAKTESTTTVPQSDDETTPAPKEDQPATGDANQPSGDLTDQSNATVTPTALKAKQALADTVPTSIDQWMPDKNLQQLVLKTLNTKNKLGLTSVSEITPDMMKQLTSLVADSNLQETDEAYYNVVTGIKSLQGLEYAPDLTNLSITPNYKASEIWKKDDMYRGALTDISALANSKKLSFLTISKNQVSDISALKDVAQAVNDAGGFSVWSMGYNQIFDARPLMVKNKSDMFMVSAGNQELVLPEVTLNPDTKSYLTSSPFYSNLFLNGTSKTDNKNIQALTDSQGSTGIPNDWGYNRYLLWDVSNGPATGKLIYAMDQYGNQSDDTVEPFTWNAIVTIPYKLVAGVGASAVNFKLIDGVTLAPDVTINGATGTDFDALQMSNVQQTIAELAKKGFTLVRASTLSSPLDAASVAGTQGTFGTDAGRVTLEFGFKQVIHLVDQAGNALQPAADQIGGQGDTWTYQVPTIDGYTYDRTQGATATGDAQTGYTLTGTLAQENADIYVYFKAATIQQVVNFIGDDGTVLHPAGTVSGAVGSTQTLQLPTIADYVVDHSDAGTVANGQLEVTLTDANTPINVYFKQAVYQHLVHFIDADGNELAPAQTVAGTKDSQQTLTLPTIDDYVADSEKTTAGTLADGQLTLTITNDESPINVYFKQAVYQHLVHFIDADGHELAPAQTVAGTKDSQQVLDLPNIDDYQVDPEKTTAGTLTDGQLTLTIANDESPINVYFTPVIYQQLIHFVDPDGQTLAPDVTVNGTTGTLRNVDLPTLAGFELDHATSGTVAGQQLIVKLAKGTAPINVYFKVVNGQVIVHYQDLQGNDLADPVTLTGQVTTDYTSEPLATVPGDYQLVSTPFNAQGTYTKEDQNVVYLYRKIQTGGGGDHGNPDQPETPDVPETPEVPEQPGVSEQPGTPEQPAQEAGDGAQLAEAPTLTDQVAPEEVATLVRQGGDAATIDSATMQATAERPAQPLATKGTVTTSQPAQATTTTQLPQTNDQQQSWLQVIGATLLGSLTAVTGWVFSRQRH
ncbi:MucBP domain-containing protein [Levilactobacillus namurensis]|uniref:MucBP domain-containing protein n=1 Tax=Levilactobacillus namurensis TaxID=380393 RepID=UPI0026F2E845|nr:MucBP domain-containing protein [Levilactobacillus namurensis]